jgi:hypothetical protein
LLIGEVASFEERGLALENQQSDVLQSSIHAVHQDFCALIRSLFIPQTAPVPNAPRMIAKSRDHRQPPAS